MSYIKTWVERCDEHPDHQSGMVSNGMIQARMQEEIDDLREALAIQQGCCDGAAAQDAHVRQEREEARAEIERLREALKPFAAEAEVYDPPEGDDAETAWFSLFTCGNLRDARAALEGKP